ncbi:MAG: hypothetical protein LBI54_05000 [Lachnospiraceae bacterium]|jgi:hypothetical protein|nr:hypothetical protein [Lachnospiraceae bacterium]
MDAMTAEQALEAAKELTFEKVWAALMESKARMEEINIQTNDEIKKTAKLVAELSKNMGGLQNSVSQFIETMLSADLCAKFNELGYEFTRLTYHNKYKENGKPLAEVDAILENGDCILLSEVKTKLATDDVDEHLERIETIRGYMDKRGDTRKIIGAVAGGVVSDDVVNYAQKRGLFVIVQSGDSAAIADMPKGFAARVW